MFLANKLAVLRSDENPLGLQVDVYSKEDRPVAFVIWRGKETAPAVMVKAVNEIGGMALTSLTSNDDVPEHDHLEMLKGVQLNDFSLTGGRVESLGFLKKGAATPTTYACGTLPDFRIVLLDETKGWTDPALVQKAGKIWSAYLYDARRPVNLAELTPSYELNYLYATSQNELPDDMQEVLQSHGAPEDGVIYMHCRALDGISWDRKHVCSEPNDLDVDSYEALVAAEVDHYRGNCAIDVPRTMGYQLVAVTGLALLDRGAGDEVQVLLKGLPSAAQTHFAQHGDLAASLRSLEGAIAAAREAVGAAVVIDPNSILLERAQAANRFHAELFEQYDALSSLEAEHGPRIGADLFLLQSAILRGEEVGVRAQSKLFVTLQQLPSSSEWLSHVKAVNKFGEPVRPEEVSAAPRNVRETDGPSL